MNPTWQSKDGSIRLFRADCRDVLPLPRLAETCITDPPYDLTANKKGGSGAASLNVNSPAGRSRVATGFMGKSWDGTGVAFDPATWAKVLESLKPGAMLLSFGGPRTYHRMTCAIEDAGFGIRDCLCWLYGSGFPKSLDVSKAIDKAAGEQRERIRGVRSGVVKFTYAQDAWSREFKDSVLSSEPITATATAWNGWGTALKPAFEPIVLAMKPLDGTYAENAQRHGVSGLNINAARIPLNGDYKCKANGRPSQTGLGDNYDPDTANKPDDVGRWPANVILDGSPEALAGFPETGVSSGGNSGTRGNQVYGRFGESQPGVDPGFNDSRSASRFFYCAKANAADRRNSKHPTVKPISLLKYLCKLTMTPTGGTVLDPFMGSGTTMEACYELGRPFIGVEREQEYFDDCVSRAKEIICRYGLVGSSCV